MLEQVDDSDVVSKRLHERQQKALSEMPETLSAYPVYSVPMRSYNLSDIANIRRMLHEDVLVSVGDSYHSY